VVFVPVAAVVFLGLWLISQFLLPIEGVAWQAHVGGFIAGMLITLPLRTRLLGRVERAHARHHAPFYG
jgi:membrane associated rhomboid family serine protease